METAKALTALGDADRERIRTLGRVAPSALQVHQAMFARPVATIPAICAATGQSPHTVNKMLDAMIKLGLVRADRNEAQPYLRIHRLPGAVEPGGNLKWTNE